jgi:hypothetical protein
VHLALAHFSAYTEPGGAARVTHGKPNPYLSVSVFMYLPRTLRRVGERTVLCGKPLRACAAPPSRCFCIKDGGIRVRGIPVQRTVNFSKSGNCIYVASPDVFSFSEFYYLPAGRSVATMDPSLLCEVSSTGITAAQRQAGQIQLLYIMTCHIILGVQKLASSGPGPGDLR